MRSFVLAGLAAGLLLSMIGTASAQSYDGDRPRYRDIEPGTVANGAGLCRTASANPIGHIRLCRS